MVRHLGLISIKRLIWCYALLIASTLPIISKAASPSVPPDQAVWRSGEDGYHTYRIPSLLVTPKGTVLAFCEGRKSGQHDQGDIDLLMKRSDDGGRHWSKQQVVWDDAANTCGNPCPVVDRDTGKIWMLMTWNRGDDVGKKLHDGTSKGTRHVFVTSSTNDGRDWTTPIEITKDVKLPDWHWYATGPGVGIQIRHGQHKGRLVIPCDYTAKGLHWGSLAVISDDHGKTWRIGGLIGPNTNECQLVELDDGKGGLLMNLRSAAVEADCRLESRSDDGGETWSTATPATLLPDPRCQGSILRYSWRDEGANRLLFSNPANPKDRKSMTVRLSLDDGKTWPVSKEIFGGPSAYSCLARLPDGKVGLVFEGGPKHRREAIYFVTLSPNDLTTTASIPK